MAAADEVPLPGAGEGIAVFRIVHRENLLSSELEARVGAVVLELPVPFAHPAREGTLVADVVAVNEMQRQADGERRPQSLRADEIAAVDHRLGALLLCQSHRLGERVGAVVAVREDADLHAADVSRWAVRAFSLPRG